MKNNKLQNTGKRWVRPLLPKSHTCLPHVDRVLWVCTACFQAWLISLSPRHKGKKLNALGIMGGDSRDHISGLASLCWFSLCPRTSDFSGPFFFLVSFLCVFFFFSLICKIEGQAGIKIAGRNTNNLRYADDTTLIAESEEELKSLLMRVKKLA